MSLYGALFAGVAGLTSQARKLGVISDNVSNVNTVGYKGGNALFETLVTSSSSTSAYSPGGVIGGSRQLVSKQGLLQATDSATDIAISGNGFFVVNQSSDASGQVLYTRSGSFRADSLGNYRNASGFYLMAWPLDRNGLLPGEAGNTTYTTSNANISSLQVVNVGNLTGSAAATTSVSIGANLNASQTVFPGADGDITMDDLSTDNFGISAKDIIVPSSTNHIDRGDKIRITADGTTHTYTYGGFSRSRNVESGTAASSDSGLALLDASTTLDDNPFAFTAGSNVVTVTHADHGLADGAVVTFSGNTEDMAGIDSAEFNGDFVIDVIDEDTYTITTATAARATTSVTSNTVATSSGANATVTINVGAPSLFSVGQEITVAGSNVVNGITINGTHTITAVSGNTVTWATTTTTPPALASHAFSTVAGANSVVTVNVGSTNTYTVGQSIVIAGADAMNGVTLNGTHTVTAVSGSNVSFATTDTAAAVTLANNPVLVATGANPTVTLTVSAGHGYIVGQSITVAGATATNGADPNGTFTVTAITGTSVSYVATGQTGGGSPGVAGGGASVTTFKSTGGGASATNFLAAGGGTAITAVLSAGGGDAVLSTTRPFNGNILDASDAETRFLGTTGTSGFTATGLTFTITTAATGTVTFSYRSSSPDVRQKQFNTLSNLAESINNVTGLSARVVDGQLHVGPTDATSAITFENGSTTGTEGPPVQAGIDWVRELGLKNVASQENRFSSLQGLYNLAAASSDISATLANPLGQASLSINADNPLTTISFADAPDLDAFDTFTNATPFQTTSGSNEVFIEDSDNASNVAVGDIITLDMSAFQDIDISDTGITSTIGANPTVTIDITGLGLSFAVGESITLSGAANVNSASLNGTWEIATASATAVTFVATGVTTSGVAAAGGGSSAKIAFGTIGGIPLSDFELNDGRFEVVSKSTSGYTIGLASDATITNSTGYGEDGLIITPHTNKGSLLAELGLVDSLDGDAYTPQETDDFGPSYDPLDEDLSMASGSVSPQFSRPIRVYDAQGGGHDLNVAFLKTGSNEWAIEVYAVPEDDVSSSFASGLVAYGNITFNGDGTLNSIDSELTEAIPISWTNGALASEITFDWGTAGEPFGTTGATTFGEADGLSQFNTAYKVAFANQNGAPVGELTGVSITELGVIVASYSNGETQDLFKIPIAAFANPDQLESNSGNVFEQSSDSGEFNLQQAGTSGVGKIASSSLEASNVELSTELTDMIVAQRSYQANAKVISTSDNMLNVLNDIIR